MILGEDARPTCLSNMHYEDFMAGIGVTGPSYVDFLAILFRSSGRFFFPYGYQLLKHKDCAYVKLYDLSSWLYP